MIAERAWCLRWWSFPQLPHGTKCIGITEERGKKNSPRVVGGVWSQRRFKCFLKGNDATENEMPMDDKWVRNGPLTKYFFLKPSPK